MNRLLLPVASALVLALPAQDKPSPFRFVPADSLLVMRCGAPAKWQEQFAATKVAKLLQGAALGPLVKQLSAGIDQGMAELRASGKGDADLIEKLLRSYKGELVLSVQADLDGVMDAIENGEAPAFSVVVALTPDGSYDLAALATTIAKVAEEDGDALRDLTVGDHRLRMAGTGPVQTTMPAVVDGHLVMLIGSDLEQGAAKLLGKEGRFAGDAGGHAMQAHIRFAPLMKALGKVVAMEAESNGAPFDVAKLFDQIGLNALGDVAMSLGADGDQVVGETSVAFGDGERGIFAMFASDGGTPKLMRVVPPDSESFSLLSFRLGALVDTIGKVWTGLGDAVPMSWTDAQAAFAEQMKVRLKEDLLDHVGGELLVIQDVEAAMAEAAGADEDDPMAALGSMCLGFHLRDGKAFGESVEKMLRARGLHASRKTEDYQGTPVHRLRLAAMFEMEYAVTDDLLLLGLGKGESARQALRAVLDTRKSPAADGETPAAVKKALAAMPGGWSGISATAMPSFVSGFAGAMETAMQQAPVDLPAELTMVLTTLRAVGAEMKRLGLQTMVSATWSTARGMTSRFRW